MEATLVSPTPTKTYHDSDEMTGLIVDDERGYRYAGYKSRWARRIHACFCDQRELVINALGGATMNENYDQETSTGLHKRALKMFDCCAFPTIRSRDGVLVPSLNRCRDRMCPTCASFRAKETAEKIQALVKPLGSIRFITLTLTNSPELKPMVQRLSQCFKELRRRNSWKAHVKGGVYSVEITRDEETETWHAHLHLIVDGSYYDQEELSNEWLAVTGDSMIVDIRKIANIGETAKYISDYVSKSGNVDCWSDSAIREYAIAMKGRRMVHTFGNAHGVKVDEKGSDNVDRSTEHVISIGDLASRIEHDPRAAEVVDKLCKHRRIWSKIFNRPWVPGVEPIDEEMERVCKLAIELAAPTKAEKAIRKKLNEQEQFRDASNIRWTRGVKPLYN